MRNQQLKRLLVVAAVFLALATPHALARRQTGVAPGAPGHEARWPSAGKEGVGTSNTPESKFWFTLRGGVLDEVYYPTVDVANSQTLQLVVAHMETGSIQTEERDTVSRIVPDPGSLSFTQVNTAKNGEYRIEKSYTTDPRRNVVLVRVRFSGHLKRRENDYRLFVYYDPSLGNSGLHDTGFTQGGALVARDGDKASALLVSADGGSPDGPDGFTRKTNGFLGVSDGLTQMLKDSPRKFPPEFTSYERAEDGNVVQ